MRAETFPSTVGSVRFALDGNANFQTESVAPYALAGDTAGDYNPWTPALGAHTLTATPFTGGRGRRDGRDGPDGELHGGGERSRACRRSMPGPGQVVTLPANSVSLGGTATDNGTIVSTVWTQQSGPEHRHPQRRGHAEPDRLGPGPGRYVFRLTATDDESNTRLRRGHRATWCRKAAARPSSPAS